MTSDLPSAGANTRRRRLAAAVAATLAATVWAAVQDDEAGIATATPPTSSRPTVTTAAIPQPISINGSAWPDPAHAGERTPWNEATPQGLVAWGPPMMPPPPTSAGHAPDAAASVPAAPPDFPYTLIGRLDDGQARALLTNRTRSFGAKQGDVIDDVWRVDEVEADGVTLTWLPGGVSRTLAFPSS